MAFQLRRTLRRYRRHLRRDAREMRHIFDEQPARFGARVRKAWGANPAGDAVSEHASEPWPRVG